ncbi:RNA polymerase sigma factor [Sulfuriferula sp.]|uniref:RNA polymerase sigma factor n=1 Tax=Sulfuriferula sp. TaxID=2025307 RepID=UPI0027315CC1|nr:RNA polymerase sigma factor [Sulfuriferula sp.]MDP2027440.1 RNA polymerase sigma factor [Sulfuriferula sp.]
MYTLNTQSSSQPFAHDLTDVELVAAAQQGDPRAFERIMRQHNRLLFRSARSILKNDDDTEDAVQAAYLSAWRALGSFRAEAKLATWLVRIVVNESLGRLRRRGAQIVPLDTAMDADAPQTEAWMEHNPDEQPERLAMRAQVRQLIEAGIDQLPDAFRTVFMLRAVEELSVEEVAAALAIPEATVRSRFFRARGLLREGLARDIDVSMADAFSFAGVRCDRIVARVLADISGQISPRS